MTLARIISVSKNLVDEVLSVMTVDGIDLDRILVVFPGKRPSHFLRKALAARLGKAFIPPRMYSYDEFIEHLSRKYLGNEKPDLDKLDASALLYDIHVGFSERLGGEHFSSFDRFLPLGFRLFDELEELLLAGADPRSVAETIGGLTFGGRHLLPEYFERFYKTIRSDGLITRSSRLVDVAERIESVDLSQFKRIILAGFYALTPTDRRIFSGLASREQTVMVFQEGPGLRSQLQWLEESGQNARPLQMDLFDESGGNGTAREEVAPAIHLYKSTEAHGQIFALSAVLKSFLEQGEKLDERTVIVLPSSESLFPVLYHALALLGENDYNISLGYPLSRSPLYGLLGSLLDLIATARGETVHAGTYIRFVLHPYIKNFRFGRRTDITRVLFHALEELLARQTLTMVSLARLEGEHSLFERIARGLSDDSGPLSTTALKDHVKRIHDTVIRPFLMPGTLGDVATKIIDLVLLINSESTAYRHPLFARYAEELIGIAEKIRGSAAAGRRFEDVTSYATFLRDYVGPQVVPFPGTPLRGLQVLGLLETRSLSFDRVFVLDVSDDVIPGTRATETLLPQKVRKRLGLETHRDRERLIEYYFNVLMGGARDVYLFFTENDKRQRSRFVEKILWLQEQARMEPVDSIKQARYRIHLAHINPSAKEKSPPIADALKQFDFSATALDVYLRCELRFYYRYVLGLREKDEVRREVEALDVGNLVHRILKEYFDPFVGKTVGPADIKTDEMERMVEKVFDRTFENNQHGAVFLLKRQIVAKMKEYVEEYQKRVLEEGPVEIEGLEQEVSVRKNSVKFSGRIDRIERRDGRVYILDYKTRQDDAPQRIAWKKFNPTSRETWAEAIGSLQLPMYSLLYTELTGEPVRNVVPAFLFLGRNYIDRTIETGLSKDGVVTEEMQRNLHRVILGLAKEAQDPAIPFRPVEDLKKECPGCPYQVMCGTQWAKEGRW
jgi:ATP-dependent helicase/nuclease subunit B